MWTHYVLLHVHYNNVFVFFYHKDIIYCIYPTIFYTYIGVRIYYKIFYNLLSIVYTKYINMDTKVSEGDKGNKGGNDGKVNKVSEGGKSNKGGKVKSR